MAQLLHMNSASRMGCPLHSAYHTAIIEFSPLNRRESKEKQRGLNPSESILKTIVNFRDWFLDWSLSERQPRLSGQAINHLLAGTVWPASTTG